MPPMRILITGASGFIGGQLAKRFRSLGWSVTGIGRRPLDDEAYLQHDLARPLPPDLGPFDVIVHAAARSSPWGRRRDFRRDNVGATQNVIDFCHRIGRPRLIFLSSSSVYYRPANQLNITEETPLPAKSVNDYAATKRRAEVLVRQYPGVWSILRPRAVIGPGDTVLLPRILRAARTGWLPWFVSPNGPVIGDLIYIDNLVDCVVAAASRPGIQGDFNLTNNQPVEINQFLAGLLQRLGIPLPRGEVSVHKAMFLAGLLEGFYAVCLPNREPPMTRFGVHVFAYSKTFDVTKMLVNLGPPRFPLEEGREQIVASLQGASS